MTDSPVPHAHESEDRRRPESDPATTDTGETPRLQSSVESTVVTGSTEDDEWSLGPVPSTPGSPMPDVPESTDLKNLTAGAVIGDFQVQRVLGTGAFATVYLAMQLSLNRFVALKVTGDLGHEGRRMARLEHPNVVQVYAEEILHEQRIRLLTMQYVPGPTLQGALNELVQQDSSPCWSGADLLRHLDSHTGAPTDVHPDDYAIRIRLEKMDHQQAVCFLTAELASGLKFAHSHDVLHRDIKPANILLNAVGRPLLVDFNLSEEASETSGDQGMVGGTLAYMSPEHLKAFEYSNVAHIPVGPAADIYSLALVMVQMLSGRLPLPTSDSGRPASGSHSVSVPTLRKQRSKPFSFQFEAPSASQASLQAVIHRATDPEPATRTSDGEVFSQELHSCQRLRSIETTPVMQHPLLKIAERHPVTAFATLAIAPQLIASIVNIVYNNVRVPELSVPVSESATAARYGIMDAFPALTFWYNVVLWPFCLALVAIIVRRSLNAIRMAPCETEEQERVQRQVLVGLPHRMLQIGALGWIPGIVVFPFGLWFTAGVDLREAFVHFTLNFVTSALLAMTYSYLGMSWLVTSVSWPRHWLFPRQFDSRAVSRELGHFSGGLKQARLAAAVVPLLSCILLILSTHVEAPNFLHHFDQFRLLLILLIGLGLFGPLTANRVAYGVSERLRIYSAG
ncbi:MAG: serine/threonine-protein kinase [Planctomycetaceae bacterium]